jgi:hypothetical protein
MSGGDIHGRESGAKHERRHAGKQFFFEKKNQKTFAIWP